MKSLSLIIGLTFAFALTFSSSGCTTKVVQAPASVVPANTSKEKVANAIKAGAAEKGWVAKESSDGTMELTLLQRTHRVVVTVTYSAREYAVKYKDSTNMKYDPARGTIHTKYDKWVALLKEAIDRKLL